MVKQFKIVLSHILDAAVHKPKFVELLTYIGSAVIFVNEKLLVPLNDDFRDFTAMSCKFQSHRFSCQASNVEDFKVLEFQVLVNL